ncbi:class II aldolase/adducin family protein [Paracoccus aminophilus]|uniref:Short chain dehydrogenase n=1 Tax=Paracoccus aminophilus JCM 7686 TaxID=1367847 RepID=S5Y4R8_PARAH|nr:class II aldolase/adducin family protein [Paracoccus aminophilus]AGT10735.1 short chain dehydrogenase [Paracoccus aminophilus JCM 7686]
MQSRWSDEDARRYSEEALAAGQPAELGLRVYSSRIIGQDPDLVLHGGGNTSVKINSDQGAVIHVKGSGWDLGDIQAPGLPAMWLAPLLKARQIKVMSDPDMVAFLRENLLDPAAPTPSVEALLHAFLPFSFVDHTHATAILALADQDDMEETVARLYGGRVGYVPYVMPGFDLSHACDAAFAADRNVEGLWLAKHGLFTFGATAEESYARMIEFVTMAEAELAARGALPGGPEANTGESDPAFEAALVAELAARQGLGDQPALNFRASPSILKLLDRPDLAEIVHRGTATPDHVIRLKPFPLIVAKGADRAAIGAALDAFAANYRAYFERNAPHASEPKTVLDSLPRAVLVPGLGLFGLGANAKAAAIAGDLWEQSARVILSAEAAGRYAPISERELFDMEYWSLEQAKLQKK